MPQISEAKANILNGRCVWGQTGTVGRERFEDFSSEPAQSVGVRSAAISATKAATNALAIAEN